MHKNAFIWIWPTAPLDDPNYIRAVRYALATTYDANTSLVKGKLDEIIKIDAFIGDRISPYTLVYEIIPPNRDSTSWLEAKYPIKPAGVVFTMTEPYSTPESVAFISGIQTKFLEGRVRLLQSLTDFPTAIIGLWSTSKEVLQQTLEGNEILREIPARFFGVQETNAIASYIKEEFGIPALETNE